MNSFDTPRPKKVEVFFTDEERLLALAQVHQGLLDDEPSGALRLTETLHAANELAAIIDGHKVAVDSSHPVPAILQLELDETQVATLSLARNFSRKTPEQTSDRATLLS